jgi:hypothetical protein
MVEGETSELAEIAQNTRWLHERVQDLVRALFGTNRAVFDEEGLSMRVMWLHERSQKIDAALGRIELAALGILMVLAAHVWHHWSPTSDSLATTSLCTRV